MACRRSFRWFSCRERRADAVFTAVGSWCGRCYREPSSVYRQKHATRVIFANQSVSVVGSQSADRVWDTVAAKRPVSSSSWPRNIATILRVWRRASAESAAPTTSLSAVAREATVVAKEMHPTTLDVVIVVVKERKLILLCVVTVVKENVRHAFGITRCTMAANVLWHSVINNQKSVHKFIAELALAFSAEKKFYLHNLPAFCYRPRY